MLVAASMYSGAARFGILAFASAIIGSLVHYAWGLSGAQTISVTVFLIIILATLFFWSFRLAIAFIGLPVLILTGTLELECFRQHCSLEVILFLMSIPVSSSPKTVGSPSFRAPIRPSSANDRIMTIPSRHSRSC
jgi:hypothetical protein